ncbi:L-ribulose-5-phosphate 4-epimerase [Peptoanaerobacter stomatis]|uniref:L-ribulose-5-phosphate 4-epimerase n=1 Tax=Peptoanaerobacter stomatis TaxID=796937 RepID=V9HJD4_9FIRM|nr:L-fuculose-phosphate aldolase [Peptoanaerobacter stomatis]EHL14614.1 L-ribulose-5-phosphate 4-epimerase [Peptoanaerobacter stomatis]
MLMREERIQLIEFGKKLVESRLTKGTGGNLSIYDRKNGHIAITPSGIDFFEIKLEDIVILDIDENIIEGDKKPSSELEMHLILYRTRQDINAVIHAHTIYSTVLGCLNLDLPATHYLTAVAGTNVRCAKYATYGTKQLAINACEAMEDRKAVILANHGILTGGRDLPNAFSIAEDIEYCSEIYCKARSIGEPVILSNEEMKIIAEKFKKHGQNKANL